MILDFEVDFGPGLISGLFCYTLLGAVDVWDGTRWGIRFL